MFADVCASSTPCELSARSGTVALGVVYAALRSIDKNGACVKLEDILQEARAKLCRPTMNNGG